MVEIIGEEFYGSKEQSLIRRQLSHTDDGRIIVVDFSQRYTGFSNFFRSVFLPHGYPHSVSSDYLPYQIWDTIQAFASSITGSLAAERMLAGLGVGKQDATVLGATMTWILKHFTGMVGQIVFAWLQGTALDCDAKRWRLFADILNDVSIFLEILAPAFGPYFIIIACLAGVGKSIVGVSGGATRASLTQHQARRNNLADVAAKDGSQETLVNLAALICSLIILPVVSGKLQLTWLLFALFTMVHLYANYRAVKSVVMEELNQTRLHILVDHYLATGQSLTLTHANHLEPVLRKIMRRMRICNGVPLNMVFTSCSDIALLRSTYRNERYILNMDPARTVINIAYHESAGVLDELKSLFQAEVIEYASLPTNQIRSGELSKLSDLINSGNLELLCVSKRITDELFPRFICAITNSGWITAHALLGSDEWRSIWPTL